MKINIMAFQLDPSDDITENVKRAGVRQIDKSLKRLSATTDRASAVHGMRKAMKRLRALLHLVKPAMTTAEFRRMDGRIKKIGRLLSGVRDIQAMLECMAKLESAIPAAATSPVGPALRNYLAAKQKAAEEAMQGETDETLRAELQELDKAFAGIKLKGDGFDVLTRAIKTDYRKARHGFQRAYDRNEDEEFHEWRKDVQRHWRQLLLLEPGWPGALRPHIDLVSELAEMLGDDHDLHVLAGHVQDAGRDLGSRKVVAAYLALCRKRQEELRVIARLMGERLFAETPSSLAARLTAYWRTQPEFENVLGSRVIS